MMVNVIGAGLAGCECALQLLRLGAPVRLWEMKPKKFSPAHSSPSFAELVCSNSLKSRSPTTPAGLLKEEMKAAGSLLIPAAEKFAVPAGQALAVDRDKFAAEVTRLLEQRQSGDRLEIVRQECTEIPAGEPAVIATGPLTSEALSEQLAALIGRERLYFYDAISPIVEADSIDMERAFIQSRYDKGGADYINCPLDEREFADFVGALLAAEKVKPREFEEPKYFESCLPLEVIAERGEKALTFGPFKPVGLTDPKTGKRPFAVVQLRSENLERSAYSLVACQTRMTYPEQRRVLRMIPALGQAKFLRLGSVHRNTYIESPKLLDECFALKSNPEIHFAGQIIGVEGYVESMAAGLLAGLFLGFRLKGLDLEPPPRETALGSLYDFVLHGPPFTERYDPQNINFGLLPTPAGAKKSIRKEVALQRAREAFIPWLDKLAKAPIGSV